MYDKLTGFGGCVRENGNAGERKEDRLRESKLPALVKRGGKRMI